MILSFALHGVHVIFLLFEDVHANDANDTVLNANANLAT